MNKLKTFITQFNLLLIFSIASLPSIARVVPSNLISDGMVLHGKRCAGSVLRTA